MSSSMTPYRLSGAAYAGDPTYRVCQEPTRSDARLLVALWRERAAKGDIIVGKDIPSRAFAKFLSHIMIVEPMNGNADALVRVAGTAMRLRYGAEVTGKRLSEIYSPSVLPQYLLHLREVRNTGEPLVLEAAFLRDEASPVAFDKIILRASAPDRAKIWNVVGVFLRNSRELYRP